MRCDRLLKGLRSRSSNGGSPDGAGTGETNPDAKDGDMDGLKSDGGGERDNVGLDVAALDELALEGLALPKMCGADVELGNFIIGRDSQEETGDEASRLLLAAIDGIPASCAAAWYNKASAANAAGYTSWYALSTCDVQDRGRKYTPTSGSSWYIDLSHAEGAMCEVVSAFDHLAVWHAMLRDAQAARIRATAELEEGESLEVLVNNSDGMSHSYGSHFNFLLTRREWNILFDRKLHHLQFLASHHASSIVYTGAGKVGSENYRPDVEFQLSQRADFFESLVGEQTTYRRPLVNRRDEALCGNAGRDPLRRDSMVGGGGLARLHCINFDAGLCHVAHILKVGVQQIVLSMLEANRVDVSLLLDDPVDAVLAWSHDATLQRRCATISGREVTAVEFQRGLHESAVDFEARYGLPGVPRAKEILDLWGDTLMKLERGAWPELAGRLDWVLKRHAVERAAARHGYEPGDPALKYLDHLYSNLDAERGLYWAYERAGVVERMVDEQDIDRFMREPPEDTRAWARAMLLRTVDPSRIVNIDWDKIRVRVRSEHGYDEVVDVNMPDPLHGFTKADAIEPFLSWSGDADRLVRALAGADEDDERDDDETKNAVVVM